MEYRGNKRPHSELENLQDKYERLWDELDSAFLDISKSSNKINQLENNIEKVSMRLQTLENNFSLYKTATDYDINVNHTNINYVSMRLIAVVLIIIIYIVNV